MTLVIVFLALLAVIAALLVAKSGDWEIRRKDTTERDNWGRLKEANKNNE